MTRQSSLPTSKLTESSEHLEKRFFPNGIDQWEVSSWSEWLWKEFNQVVPRLNADCLLEVCKKLNDHVRQGGDPLNLGWSLNEVIVEVIRASLNQSVDFLHLLPFISISWMSLHVTKNLQIIEFLSADQLRLLLERVIVDHSEKKIHIIFWALSEIIKTPRFSAEDGDIVKVFEIFELLETKHPNDIEIMANLISILLKKNAVAQTFSDTLLEFTVEYAETLHEKKLLTPILEGMSQNKDLGPCAVDIMLTLLLDSNEKKSQWLPYLTNVNANLIQKRIRKEWQISLLNNPYKVMIASACLGIVFTGLSLALIFTGVLSFGTVPLFAVFFPGLLSAMSIVVTYFTKKDPWQILSSKRMRYQSVSNKQTLDQVILAYLIRGEYFQAADVLSQYVSSDDSKAGAMLTYRLFIGRKNQSIIKSEIKRLEKRIISWSKPWKRIFFLSNKKQQRYIEEIKTVIFHLEVLKRPDTRTALVDILQNAYQRVTTEADSPYLLKSTQDIVRAFYRLSSNYPQKKSEIIVKRKMSYQLKFPAWSLSKYTKIMDNLIRVMVDGEIHLTSRGARRHDEKFKLREMFESIYKKWFSLKPDIIVIERPPSPSDSLSSQKTNEEMPTMAMVYQHQDQHVETTEQQMTVEQQLNSLAAEQNNVVFVFSDQSHVYSEHELHSQLNSTFDDSAIILWLRSLYRELIPFGEVFGKVQISSNAFRQLLNCHFEQVVRTTRHFSKDHLPLGFYLENEGVQYTLKYDPEYRKEQLSRGNPENKFDLDSVSEGCTLKLADDAKYIQEAKLGDFLDQLSQSRVFANGTKFEEKKRQELAIFFKTDETKKLLSELSTQGQRYAEYLCHNHVSSPENSFLWDSPSINPMLLTQIIVALIRNEQMLQAKGLSLPNFEAFRLLKFTSLARLNCCIDIILKAAHPELQLSYINQYHVDVRVHKRLTIHFYDDHCRAVLSDGYRFVHHRMLDINESDIDQMTIDTLDLWLNFFEEDNSFTRAAGNIKRKYTPEAIFLHLAARYLEDSEAVLRFLDEIAGCDEKTKIAEMKEYWRQHYRPVQHDLEAFTAPGTNSIEVIWDAKKIHHLMVKQMGLSENLYEELKPILLEFYKDTDEMHTLSPVELKNQLNQLKNRSSFDVVYCLKLLREAVRRSERKKLRLEQALVILLYFKDFRLFEIETSEGKSLVLKLIGLLSKLKSREKTYFIATHTLEAAQELLKETRLLAQLLGFKVDILHVGTNLKQDCLYFVEANTLIYMAQEESEKFFKLTGIFDEIDNFFIDVAATTLFQIPDGNGSDWSKKEGFSDCLKAIFQSRALSLADLTSKLDIDLSLNPYWQYLKNAPSSEEMTLARWQQAAQISTSENCCLGKHYTIDNLQIFIVSYQSTGFRNEGAIWSEGLHHMVVIKERLRTNTNDIQLPPCQSIRSSSDGLSPLLYLKDLAGVTATIGGEESLTHTLAVLRCRRDQFCRLPRAQRSTDPNKGSKGRVHDVMDFQWSIMQSSLNWPMHQTDLKSPSEETLQVYYNRRVDYSPLLYLTYNEHVKAIVTTLLDCVRYNYSALVFFETIEQCEVFYQILVENHFNRCDLQVFDQGGGDNIPRPVLSAILEGVNRSRMITLTTAAGGRALDTTADIGFITTLNIWRVMGQKAGRIGRNGQVGNLYSMFCLENFTVRPNVDLLKAANKTEEKIDKETRDEIKTFLLSQQNLAGWLSLAKKYGLLDDETSKALENKTEEEILDYFVHQYASGLVYYLLELDHQEQLEISRLDKAFHQLKKNFKLLKKDGETLLNMHTLFQNSTTTRQDFYRETTTVAAENPRSQELQKTVRPTFVI